MGAGVSNSPTLTINGLGKLEEAGKQDLIDLVRELRKILGAETGESVVYVAKDLVVSRDGAVNKWQEYERDYILPCFGWARELGWDLEEMVRDNPSKNCVELLVRRLMDERENLSKLGSL